MLEIIPFTLGPVQTNAYLLADGTTGEAAVIDPAWEGEVILGEAKRHGWRIGQLWYTHAHFDHTGGAAELARGLTPEPVIALHPLDEALWKLDGGAAFFGMKIDPGPKPNLRLEHNQILSIGNATFEVRHTPGHTEGHCVFYCAEAKIMFSGDLIFQGSVGRCDLPGGDWETLEKSIRGQVYTLPGETRLLSGHGPETSVEQEKKFNPFVQG